MILPTQRFHNVTEGAAELRGSSHRYGGACSDAPLSQNSKSTENVVSAASTWDSWTGMTEFEGSTKLRNVSYSYLVNQPFDWFGEKFSICSHPILKIFRPPFYNKFVRMLSFTWNEIYNNEQTLT